MPPRQAKHSLKARVTLDFNFCSEPRLLLPKNPRPNETKGLDDVTDTSPSPGEAVFLFSFGFVATAQLDQVFYEVTSAAWSTGL